MYLFLDGFAVSCLSFSALLFLLIFRLSPRQHYYALQCLGVVSALLHSLGSQQKVVYV